MTKNIPLSYWNANPELYEQTMTGIDVEVNKMLARISALENALRQIANGEGYYGAQAKEYKDIARAALGE